jgi:FkbM family methyltransferase
MSLRNYFAYGNDPFISIIRSAIFRFSNKYYAVNNIIADTFIESDGFAVCTLNSGIKIGCFPSRHPKHYKLADIQRGARKNDIDKILKLTEYHFLYEILDELYVHNPHFMHFDIAKGDTVADVGANIGGFTLQAAIKAGEKGKVYAIEPALENLEALKRNIELNKLKNVEIIKKGLWSEPTILEFQMHELPGQHSIVMGDVQAKSKKVKIDVTTFDELVKDMNISRLDFVKMDIEGAEIEAIKGMKNTLTSLKPKLVIEALHIVNGSPTYEALIPILKSYGSEIIDFDKYRGSIYSQNK